VHVRSIERCTTTIYQEEKEGALHESHTIIVAVCETNLVFRLEPGTKLCHMYTSGTIRRVGKSRRRKGGEQRDPLEVVDVGRGRRRRVDLNGRCREWAARNEQRRRGGAGQTIYFVQKAERWKAGGGRRKGTGVTDYSM
jgi:hypothetical protein